jgi:hypothetical protein
MDAKGRLGEAIAKTGGSPRRRSPALAALGYGAGFLLLAVALRFPAFFKAVINGDESAFIVVGLALADGHLPYTLAWELKPPLGFLFFAGAELLVTDSLAFIRFCGALLVATSGLLVFLLARPLVPRREALLAGALAVTALSILPSAGAVMLEQVALPPLLGGLLLLSRKRPRLRSLALAGALLGAAGFVRTNLAIVPLAMMLALAIGTGGKPWGRRLLEPLALGAGGLLVLLSTWLPYALNGLTALFVNSVFRAPLAYATDGLSHGEVALAMVGRALPPLEWQVLVTPHQLLSLFLWIAGLGGLLWLAWRRRATRSDAGAAVLVGVVAAFLSILSSGRPWGHYLLQIAPFFCIGLGFLVARLRRRLAGWVIACLALLIATSLPSPDAYARIIGRWAAGESPYEGSAFAVADYLDSVAAPQDSLFVTEDALLYWLTHRYPPIPVAAYPGNLWGEKVLKTLYGPQATPAAAMQEVLCHAPIRIVVTAKQVQDGLPEPLKSALERDYLREAEVAWRVVFRRIDGSPAPPCPLPPLW